SLSTSVLLNALQILVNNDVCPCPFSILAFDPHAPAMSSYKVLHNGEPQTRATQFPGTGAVDPVKSFSKPVQVSGRYTYAGILNEKADFPPAFINADRYTAFLSKFNAVINEVDNNLNKLVFV